MTGAAAYPRVSGSTETTENSRPVIGVTPFDWSRDYRLTFDACPSAFWLAPDAADTLPETDLLTPRPPRSDPVTASVVPDAEPTSWRVEDRATGSAIAIIAAGPLFAMFAVVMMEPGLEGVALVPLTLLMVPFTMLFGVLLSVLPITLGTLVMGWWGERATAARRLSSWIGAGALSGGVLGGLAGQTPLSLAIMAATGAACAAIARWKVRWIPADYPFVDKARTPAEAISACPPK